MRSKLEKWLEPIAEKALLVLLDRLFTALKMPDEKALPIWIEQVGKYPEPVISRAVNEVIANHIWGAQPPTVAQVVLACRNDSEFRERETQLRKIDYAQRFAKPEEYEHTPLSDEDKRVVDEAMASWREHVAAKSAEIKKGWP